MSEQAPILWAAFDSARIIAGVSLIALAVTGDASGALGYCLATFVVTGLMVSLIRRAEGDR